MAEAARATLGDEVAAGRRRLEAAKIPGAALDAAILAGHAFALDRAGLILRGRDLADPAAVCRFAGFIERRLAGEPVHRILGRRDFRDHSFALSPETLEPRPDTEVVVDLAARALAARGREDLVFADVGTGTGAIAVSLLAMFPRARCVASDISPGALVTARANAAAAGVAARFMPVCADYLAAFDGPLDLVVSNPPYISTDEIATLSLEVRGYDPRRALDGGADGLDAYRRLGAGLSAMRHRPPEIVLEIGRGQAPAVGAIMKDRGYEPGAHVADLGGHARGLWFRDGRAV